MKGRVLPESYTLLLFHHYMSSEGTKGDWDIQISDLVKNPDGTVMDFGDV